MCFFVDKGIVKMLPGACFIFLFYFNKSNKVQIISFDQKTLDVNLFYLQWIAMKQSICHPEKLLHSYLLRG